MEHRKSSRTVLRQRIGLDAPRLGPLSAVTHDLSLGGMFVEVSSLSLPPNAPVKVSFDLRGFERQEHFVLDATIVRRAPDGFGLMFTRMEPEVIRALSEALFASGRH